MQVIPAIDLLGREAVRLEQGDYARVAGYGKPTEHAARFATAGARWIHVVDLDGARAGLIRPVVVAALVHASSPAAVQASGGVRSVADAEALVRAGASRVVVGTAAWTLLDELVAALGERLVVALDVRDGVVRTRGWTESALELDDAIDRCVAGGVSRILCTALDQDGTRGGRDPVGSGHRCSRGRRRGRRDRRACVARRTDSTQGWSLNGNRLAPTY